MRVNSAYVYAIMEAEAIMGVYVAQGQLYEARSAGAVRKAILSDPKLAYFKRLAIAALKKEYDELKKAYPVGTIRDWRGGKYIKLPSKKWKPYYSEDNRRARAGIAALKRKVDKCTSSAELLDLVLEHTSRFRDKDGKLYDWVGELRDYVARRNETLAADGGDAKRNSGGGSGGEPPSGDVHLRKVEAQEFVEALRRAKASITPNDISWRVTVHSPREYKGMGATMYVSDRGSTIALGKDGDIISLCAAGSEHGKDILAKAVAMGGRKLDSYDGNFRFYTKCGFEPISWVKFNKRYAPADWSGKEEHIVFFKYTGKASSYKDKEDFYSKVAASADYASAKNIRDKSLPKGIVKAYNKGLGGRAMDISDIRVNKDGTVDYDEWVKLIHLRLKKDFDFSDTDAERTMRENKDVVDGDYKSFLRDFKKQTECKDMREWSGGTVYCLRLLW